MNFNQYQKETLRTAGGMNKEGLKNANNYILNGVLGMNEEAGEAIGIVKKHIYQGHELDKKHLAEEIGDCLWYIAVAASGIGYTLEDIAKMNVEKLHKRYPDGFDTERSINR